MLKTQELVPEIYYKESRDFQLLGRIYDIIFNYLKTNIDTITNNPLSENTDSTLLDLVSTTLGFKSLHNYNSDQLKAMSSAFVGIIRGKGSIKSIETSINTLLQVQGIKESCTIIITTTDPYVANIYVSPDFNDLNLFNDLLNYILPAGMGCNLIRQNLFSNDSTTKLTTGNIQNITQKASYETSYVPQNLGSEELPTVQVIGGAYDNAVVMPYESNAEKA